MSILGVIPARFGSTRFPGKPLALVAGKPLIQHVIERCRACTALTGVIVATDDARIAEFASQYCRVELTQSDHPSGTDRIAEVARRHPADAYVNIQGDEPLMEPSVIAAVAKALDKTSMATAATPISTLEDLQNPNVVKVILNTRGMALYFSRHAIPFLRDPSEDSSQTLKQFRFLRHLGIYGYRRETLQNLVSLPPSSLEIAERLEQLRALENGIAIRVAIVEHDSPGVDVPEDVARVEARLAKQNEAASASSKA